ncbi:hypothetical protein PP1Y_AT32869 [Novosphingobium sp. PP1Y]|nr:hypothetical protein PP1Y_AT32869 [Novosphingobium sp. PP1Y]
MNPQSSRRPTFQVGGTAPILRVLIGGMPEDVEVLLALALPQSCKMAATFGDEWKFRNGEADFARWDTPPALLFAPTAQTFRPETTPSESGDVASLSDLTLRLPDHR